LLLGKKPGLEALLPLAEKLMKGREVLLDEPGREYAAGPSLILGTRRLLSLCDSLAVGLVAWLDLDAEARKPDYNARFQAFSMVWESCWRGLSLVREQRGERMTLMQVRGSGSSWMNALRLGWGHFWKGELREREKLGLPPYGLLIQLDLPKNEDRKALIDSLERENIIAMDSGEENSPLWVAAKSTGRLRTALARRFEISRSRSGFPVVTVWSE
jgi:primosomal protein N' (replication factor Y)